MSHTDGALWLGQHMVCAYGLHYDMCFMHENRPVHWYRASWLENMVWKLIVFGQMEFDWLKCFVCGGHEDSLASAVHQQLTVAAPVVMSDCAGPACLPPPLPSQPLSAPITVHMATTSHGGWLTCTSLCACHGGAWLILAPGETKFDLKDKKQTRQDGVF